MVVGIGSWSSPTRSKGEDEYLEKEILDEEKKSVKRALSPAEAVSQRIALGCKIMALIMVTAASVAHTVRIVTGVHKGDTCSYLFSEGQWVEKKFWQPQGCMMHHYMPSEVRTCIRNKKVAIVGDSRMRNLYYQLTGELNPKTSPAGKVHKDLKFKQKDNISVEFFWQAEANESMEKKFSYWLKHPKERPDLMMAGAGSWTIKNRPLKKIVEYQTNMVHLRKVWTDLIEQMNKEELDEIQQHKLHVVPQIIWVFQAPVVESKLSDARKAITNEKLDAFNTFAETALKDSPVKILSSSHQMALGRPDQTTDGLHYDKAVISVDRLLRQGLKQKLRICDGLHGDPQQHSKQKQT